MTSDADQTEQPDAGTPPEHERPRPSSSTRGTGSGHSLGGTEGGPGIAGRVAEFAQRIRDAADAARAAAEEQRPTAEAVARVARDRAEQAMQAARPHLERAAQDVTAYAREHDEQLRTAMARAARIAASMAIPTVLRPMADAVNEELHRQPERTPEPNTADGDDSSPSSEAAEPPRP